MLIVDDSTMVHKRLKSMVEETGLTFEINDAFTYEEAVESIRKKVPEVILLDLNLPDRNGFELLKLVRQNKISSKVIIVTNNADEYYKEKGLLLGADHFIDKSNEFEKIPDLLRQIVHS